MTTPRIYRDYLVDILDAAEKAQIFLANVSYTEFIQNAEKVYAVIRALEVMGEAAKQVPIEIRDQAPTVPWRNIAGMRDVLIHQYFGVNLKRVYATVKEEVPSICVNMYRD